MGVVPETRTPGSPNGPNSPNSPNSLEPDPRTDTPSEPEDAPHWHDEPTIGGGRLNWLRAGVLGANDGIVSLAGLVIGVAGATTDHRAILFSGIAGLAAGALSMAVGEYVSVSSQTDTEKSMLAQEADALARMPHAEMAELAAIYEGKGLDPQTAATVAEQLTAHNALAAHAEVELRIDPDELTSPWQAAFASLVAFTLGALVPVLVIVIAAPEIRVFATALAVVLALAATGLTSARLSLSPWPRPLLRNVIGGLVAMGITHWIGIAIGRLA